MGLISVMTSRQSKKDLHKKTRQNKKADLCTTERSISEARVLTVLLVHSVVNVLTNRSPTTDVTDEGVDTFLAVRKTSNF